jgi:GNAT superfamily N-acetyltransferase
VVKEVAVAEGCFEDYRRLCRFHYRGGRLGPFERIFALRAEGRLAKRLGNEAVGVLVYGMPSIGCELREQATGGIFGGFDRETRLRLINRNIRCISRVIIEPRFRGLGLASRLVRETMPVMRIAIVEALAVMGRVNPFFEKAGMKAYEGGRSAKVEQLLEAFSLVGIEGKQLIDAQKVQKKIRQLPRREGKFIEGEIRKFLGAYGKRRYSTAGIERTRFVLSKLGERPIYYVWFNPAIEVSVRRRSHAYRRILSTISMEFRGDEKHG